MLLMFHLKEKHNLLLDMNPKQSQLTGELKTPSQELKTKDNVDHAGLFQQLVPWKDYMQLKPEIWKNLLNKL